MGYRIDSPPGRSLDGTRVAPLYLFENLDGSGFAAELPVDEDGVVPDYPDLFRRVSGEAAR
jgi:hypothetical protein